MARTLRLLIASWPILSNSALIKRANGGFESRIEDQLLILQFNLDKGEIPIPRVLHVMLHAGLPEVGDA